MMNALVLSGLLMGFFGGAHCVTMCGGIVGVVCSGGGCATGADERRPSRWIFPLLYNLGRVTSYALVGALLGTFGGVALADPRLDVVRYSFRAIAALAMLAAGLHLVGLPSVFGRGVGGALWRRVAPLAKRLLPMTRPVDALLLGGLWGLMPCGLLYGAFALAVSAHSPSEGALTMLAFGVGTLPVMLTMSAIAQTIAAWLARKVVRRLAGAVVLGFGILAISGLVQQFGAPFGQRHCCPRPMVSNVHDH